eukprot:SAG31_NODE_32405_length_356_cov_0.813230_1_plen_57_part_10
MYDRTAAIWRAAANQTWQDWMHGHALMENSLNVCETGSELPSPLPMNANPSSVPNVL